MTNYTNLLPTIKHDNEMIRLPIELRAKVMISPKRQGRAMVYPKKPRRFLRTYSFEKGEVDGKSLKMK